MNNWIQANRMLPTDDGDYLVRIIGTSMYGATINQIVVCHFYK
jgi:hypothetical protein